MTIYYAIGDIHGRLDRLEEIMDTIYTREPGIVVFLGDYIDRGPNSKGVIDYIRNGPREGFQFITLMGNHEEMAIKAIQYMDNANFMGWMRNGGDKTLQSFGTDNKESAQKKELIPQEYIQWMQQLYSHYETDKYYFVHAGVRPGIPLNEQIKQDKLWIRLDFLKSHYDWGKLIIHGHTPILDVEEYHNRLGIDTGAVFRGGCLSCAVLDENSDIIEIIQTERNEGVW